jgi:predicted dehydrogenase
MKFMIAGLGSIGRRHLKNLIALGEEDIVLYRSGKSTLPDDELKGYTTEFNLDSALAHEPGAVIVSNPTALHLDVAIPAAEAGCHLLLEKPISHNLERIDKLQAAVEHGGGKVLVGYQFRFHPGLQVVKRWLEEGWIGKPTSAHAHWGEYLPDWHPWEDYKNSYAARGDLGGGVLLTLCHPFDYLRWLLGDVESVMGIVGNLGDLGLEVEDTAEVVLKFASGALGSVHLDYYQRPARHNLEIIGSEGTIQWNIQDSSSRMYQASTQEWEVIPPPEGFERNDLFLAEMRHFIEVIAGDSDPVCGLDDGIQALSIAAAVAWGTRDEPRGFSVTPN